MNNKEHNTYILVKWWRLPLNPNLRETYNLSRHVRPTSSRNQNIKEKNSKLKIKTKRDKKERT